MQRHTDQLVLIDTTKRPSLQRCLGHRGQRNPRRHDQSKGHFQRQDTRGRGPLLKAEDVVYMKALEQDDATAKAASVTRKTALRDAPAATAIENASDITALKAAWDTDLLGDSPYAMSR